MYCSNLQYSGFFWDWEAYTRGRTQNRPADSQESQQWEEKKEKEEEEEEEEEEERALGLCVGGWRTDGRGERFCSAGGSSLNGEQEEQHPEAEQPDPHQHQPATEGQSPEEERLILDPN